MSLVSDCSANTTSTTVISMADMSINMTSIEPVVTLTSDNSIKNTDLIVSRSGGNMSAEWLPVSFNEIPITSNTLNISLNNSDIRPNITTIASTTRTIAPKPVTTATCIPIRQDSIGTNVGADGTQTVIITTTSDSVVNPTLSANKYSKVIPISSHIALVTSPDGSMLAVPMSSLVAKGNVNIKPSVAPVSISPAALKSKPSIITPLKILPLIAGTTSSTTVTVPTISNSKNVQTLIAPASMAFAKGIRNPTVTSALNPSINSITTGVTLIPTTVSNSILTESTSETAVISTPVTPVLNTAIKTENVCKDETSVKTDDKQSALPPLISQSTSISTNVITNSQSLTPPTLTPVSTNSTPNSNANNSTNNDLQNKSKSSNDSNSITGIEEMDSVIEIMEWKDGIGVLPGSDLKFRIDEFGHLDMINELEVETNGLQKNGVKGEEKGVKDVAQEVDKSDPDNETTESKESDSLLTCINCGQRGSANTFIRQGRFCSKSCATLEATHLKLYTKRNSELSLVKAQEMEKKKCQNKKSETSKVRNKVVEPTEQNSVVYQTENSNQTIDAEMESNEDMNEEVEDVETNDGNYNESTNGSNFSWRQYLNKSNSMAAPVKCFNERQTFPTIKNNFKVGMKLEGVDPQHPSKFCVLSVAEVCGFRLRLHFDGYRELFDFWVNADNEFIFAAGFCERTQRKLEPPLGLTPEDFNWNNYLQQTRAVAAPKHLFPASNSQLTVTPNGFSVGMKLEAVDRANTALVCVATIADIIDNWLLIHFDGWDDSYDYWAETSSPFIHAINWCRTKGRSLTPPKDYYRSSERFSWEEYMSESKSLAVSPRLFKTRASNNYKVGMKLEVVDKRNPRLVRVSSISHRQSHCIKVHFDGWDEKYDYWVDDDSQDIHPVNWCHKTDHPLQPPATDPIVKKEVEGLNSCPTPGCNGIGHIRGPKYLNHYSSANCPYTDSRIEYELPDRLGNTSKANMDGIPNEEMDENRVTPSQSPSPSESNSLNSTQKSQKTLKTQQLLGNKSRKHKLGTSPPNGANGPVSPISEPNSESAKHSRPSTPSSVTNLSSLQQSIFAMRMSQQQQEAPVCWDRHSKVTLPGIDKTKSKDVLLWSPSKVAEFIDQIPGCESVGQVFQDQLIDGEAFLLLNQNDIVKILGLKLGPAIKIFNSILVIRDNAINENV